MVIRKKEFIKPQKYISPMPIPPGETIKEFLDELGMTQKELSVRMSISEKHLIDILKGKYEITRDTAEKLEVIFKVDASFWVNLEANYRESLYKLVPPTINEDEISIAKQIPYLELSKDGWVGVTRKVEEKVIQLRKFFGVSNLVNLTQVNIAYRKANICKENKYALLSWIRIAELQAQNIETEKFNKKKVNQFNT